MAKSLVLLFLSNWMKRENTLKGQNQTITVGNYLVGVEKASLSFCFLVSRFLGTCTGVARILET